MFQIRKKKVKDVLVVSLDGDVLLGECRRLAGYLEEMRAEGKIHVVLDCDGIEFLSTRALEVIVKTAEAMRQAGGDIKLLSVSEDLRHVFKIAGVDRLFDFFRDEKSVLAQFGSGIGQVEKYLLWDISQEA